MLCLLLLAGGTGLWARAAATESGTLWPEAETKQSGSFLPEEHFSVSGNETGTGTQLVRTPEYWCYAQLTPDEQEIYRQVLSSLQEMEEETEVSTQDTAVLEEIFLAVMNDHPEIFYAEGYEFTRYLRGDQVEKLTFSGKYTMTEQEASEKAALIEAEADAWLAGRPQNSTSEYETVKYLYETLIQKTDYKLEAESNQTIVSVFLYGESVCQGYARALQYLLQKAGIACTLATGEAGGVGHAWDVVRVDNRWYHVDPTWGDVSYRLEGQEEISSRPAVSYDYLCVGSEEIKRTHTIREEEKLPVCDAKGASYYEREGLYLTEPDEAKLDQIFADALERKESFLTLKCADDSTFVWLKNVLLKEQKIFRWLPEGEGSVSYYASEEQRTLGFWL